MPLPETLPKPSANKKLIDKKAGVSASKNSTGFSTTGENSNFSLGFGLWQSNVLSIIGNVVVSPDKKYGIDGNDDEHRNDHDYIIERATEPVDDGSLSSYMSNSIVSMGTTTKSISKSGSEMSSNSSHSHIYEPRILQQQRQVSRSRRGVVINDSKLDDIPEDEPIGCVLDSATLQSKSPMKPVSSWKRLFKRYQRENANSISGLTTRQSRPEGKECVEVGSSTCGGEEHEFQSKSQASQSSRKGEVSSINVEENPSQGELSSTNEAVVAPASGIGLLSISPWFVLDAEKSPLENDDHGGEKKLSNTPIKENEDDWLGDLGAIHAEPKHANQVIETSSDDSREEHTVSHHRRKIPVNLPMPLSFRKKRKEIQKLQEQQRLRILSILESEDQSAQVNAESTLRQPSYCDSLSLNPVISTELSTDYIDGKESLPTSRRKSRLLKSPPTKQHKTGRTTVGNEKDEAQKTKTSLEQDNLVDSEKYYDGRERSFRSDKNHLKNIVVHAKAERVMHQSASGRREPDPQSEQELDYAAQQHEYLGKKKTPHSIIKAIRMRREMDDIYKRELPRPGSSSGQHKDYLGKKKSSYSILQEKRMLKEMDKIVKNKLRALEESEEARELDDRIQPFCGCSILPTCT